jgi:hypothetical protein
MMNSPDTAASMPSKEKTPAILALKRGDASAIRLIITAAFLLWPYYARD